MAFPGALVDADADLTFESAAYVVDLSARVATPRLVGSGEGFAGPVTWTADGRALLVFGRRDAEIGLTGLLRVPLDSGDTVDLVASPVRTGRNTHNPSVGCRSRFLITVREESIHSNVCRMLVLIAVESWCVQFSDLPSRSRRYPVC